MTDDRHAFLDDAGLLRRDQGQRGFRVVMKQVRNDPAQWTIIGTSPQTTVCHKPSTVSGGGKSEISKSIADAITLGNAYVADFDADVDAVEAIF